MKQKILSLFLALTLALTMAVPALAVTPEQAQPDAVLLYQLGLFQGAGTNPDGSPRFALDRAPTRAEAVTILVRLMGKEREAQNGTWNTPFTDVPDWAVPYVGYAYNNGYTNGVENDRFGSSSTVSAAQFLTFLLRAMGYADGTDFSWTAPWVLTDRLQITSGQYNAQTTSFLRADAAAIAADALYAPLKGSDQTLLAFLLDTGALDGSEAVVWDYAPLVFDENFASFLFYPVEGSPASFTSFTLNKVTINGLSCQTLQVNTPEEVSAYLASIGRDEGGFGYIEISYDEAAAKAAAKEFYTDANGTTYPLLNFAFTYTATRADGTSVQGSFNDNYYLDYAEE